MATKRQVEYEVKGNDLIITIPLDVKGVKSASGKSEVLASTRGNKPLGDLAEVPESLQQVKVGLNIYRPIK